MFAAALGYDELEIRRLEALSAVHPKVLEAFRRGKLTLRQVRMFARIADRKRQAELAETALDGYFQDYQLQQLVHRDRVTVETEALRLVGARRYAEAGGRVGAMTGRRLAAVVRRRPTTGCGECDEAYPQRLLPLDARSRPRRQRGCVMTSSRAGLPDLTTANARASAGASASGSEIGPSAHTPMLCASFAKSISGLVRTVPI